MFLRKLTLDPKTQRLSLAANLCVVIAIGAPYFFHPTGQLEVNVLKGVRWLFLGFAIAASLIAIQRGRRCAKESQSL